MGGTCEALLHIAAMMSETCCLLLPLYEERLQNIIDAKERKIERKRYLLWFPINY